MQVQLTTRHGVPVCKTVASYAEASAAVLKFIGRRGASQCPRGMGRISDGDKIVAHVSYNGKVWAGDIKGFWEGPPTAALLYDPAAR